MIGLAELDLSSTIYPIIDITVSKRHRPVGHSGTSPPSLTRDFRTRGDIFGGVSIEYML